MELSFEEARKRAQYLLDAGWLPIADADMAHRREGAPVVIASAVASAMRAILVDMQAPPLRKPAQPAGDLSGVRYGGADRDLFQRVMQDARDAAGEEWERLGKSWNHDKPPDQ